jgi:hypothetical protein
MRSIRVSLKKRENLACMTLAFSMPSHPSCFLFLQLSSPGSADVLALLAEVA